jgi:hypothetical protein
LSTCVLCHFRLKLMVRAWIMNVYWINILIFLLNCSSFNSLQPRWIVVSSYYWINVLILWIILNYHCFNFSLNKCFNSSRSYSIDISFLTYKNTNTIQKLNNTNTMNTKKINFNFEQFGCHKTILNDLAIIVINPITTQVTKSIGPLES